MKKLILASLALSITSLNLAFAEVETYKIDQAHSSVTFSIRHFVAKTTGAFNDFSGTLIIDRENFANSSVEATIQVPSVDTASEDRDAHLNQDDYFHTAKYPVMTFKSTNWTTGEKDNTYKVIGDLTMLGTTKKVALNVERLGFGPGRKGAFLSGWEATTTLNRTEWGLTAGTPAVGTEVDVTINIEAVRQ